MPFNKQVFASIIPGEGSGQGLVLQDLWQEEAGEELLRERPNQMLRLAEHLGDGFHTQQGDSSPFK